MLLLITMRNLGFDNIGILLVYSILLSADDHYLAGPSIGHEYMIPSL